MKKAIGMLAAAGLLLTATPALAAVNSSAIVIGNSNSGNISSDTNATANTGLNVAGGSQGGNGDDGGDSGNANMGGSNGDATSGNAGSGGSGGNGGAGGLVVTGNADADAGALNTLNNNSTRLRVDGGLNSSALVAGNSNSGAIVEDTDATASSGLNAAAGSTGGNGDDGGDSGDATKTGDQGNATTGSGGAGGAGGAGGVGGEVRTGHSTSNAGAINVMNTNLIRIRI